MDFRRLINILTASVCLLSLSACSLVTDDEVTGEELNIGEVYFNFAINVNLPHAAGTRADWWPRGGEHGNYNEAAFQRENEVTEVTIILYQTPDNKGLNSSSDAAVLDFVRCYPVTRAGTAKQADGGNWEAWYTTGYQRLGDHRLRFSQTYHAIAVANLDLTTSLTEGTSTLADLKDKLTNQLYLVGDATKNATECQQFVMASAENTNTVNFASVTPTKNGNELYFDLDAQGIEVERLAARIDFWSLNSEYKEKNGSAVDYDTPGYVYTVYTPDGLTPTTDRFVITHITPFNLYNAQEYLFKHVVVDDKTTVERLAPEDGSYRAVIDPGIAGKGSTKPATIPVAGYVNPLSGISESTLSTNPYRHAVKDMHPTVSADNGVDGKSGGFMLSESYYDVSDVKHTTDVAEDVIVGYAMENTMALNAMLYYYATGVIIEGDYYEGDDVSKKTHRVYYGFLRHASETIAPNGYDALVASNFDSDANINLFHNIHPNSTESPMHYSVVRNNIYRIHVGKVYQRTSPTDPPSIKIYIRVKMWDEYYHVPIYI